MTNILDALTRPGTALIGEISSNIRYR